ncbi:MAG TPA: sigma-70 family RNA polymerase sigma factor [Phycisphaerae bacterium]|nr:sigma-70 family RNA polymerase sigma factor [Phycisphaerae bacterium]
MITDEQLLVSYAGGDQNAFAELIGRYQQELFAFLARFVSDAAAADDLFQETFIQVHRNAKSFDAGRRFRPWLFTIAANKARDHLRATGRHLVQSLDNTAGGRGGSGDEATTFVDLMDSGMATPPAEIAGTEDRVAVQRVLAGLPGHYREVLVMSYFHQFSYKEMAEMLHIPLGTVKSRLHAAIACFAKSFKEQDAAQFHGAGQSGKGPNDE